MDAQKATESMVDQVPALLKSLGYPFKINRSAVISCGSHSNWPKMLGALHFLLEIATVRFLLCSVPCSARVGVSPTWVKATLGRACLVR